MPVISIQHQFLFPWFYIHLYGLFRNVKSGLHWLQPHDKARNKLLINTYTTNSFACMTSTSTASNYIRFITPNTEVLKWSRLFVQGWQQVAIKWSIIKTFVISEKHKRWYSLWWWYMWPLINVRGGQDIWKQGEKGVSYDMPWLQFPVLWEMLLHKCATVDMFYK